MNDFDGRDDGPGVITLIGGEAPDMQKIPLEQVEGDTWMVAVLDDLVAFADFREFGHIAEVLRTTRSEVARTLLN